MIMPNRAELLSIIAILIAIISAFYSYEQNELTKELNHLHIDPEISSYFYYNASENPYVVIKNNAPIKIIDVGVKHKLFSFDKIEKRIGVGVMTSNGLEDVGGDYMIFKSVLAPKEFISSELVGIAPENSSRFILAYLFDIDYYRDADMKHYNNREIFFIDNGKVIRNKDFINNEYYPYILKEINSFSFPSNQSYPLISQLKSSNNTIPS